MTTTWPSSTSWPPSDCSMSINQNHGTTKRLKSTQRQISWVWLFGVCLCLLISQCLYKSIAAFSTFFAKEFNMSYQQFTIVNEFVDVGLAISAFIAPFLQTFKMHYFMSFLEIILILTSLSPILPKFGNKFIPLLISRIIYGCCCGLFYAWTLTGNFRLFFCFFVLFFCLF